MRILCAGTAYGSRCARWRSFHGIDGWFSRYRGPTNSCPASEPDEWDLDRYDYDDVDFGDVLEAEMHHQSEEGD